MSTGKASPFSLCGSATAGLCALLLWPGSASGVPTEHGLVRVTPGTLDAAPLRRDMLVQPRDLRLPIGFDSVYRDRQHSGVYYRIGGGITARFPRSVYYSTPFGTITDIPPGTVFLIGPPPGSEDPFAYRPPSFENGNGGLETGPSRADPRLRSSRAQGARGQPLSMLGRAGPSASPEAQHAHPLLAPSDDETPDTDNPIFAGELSRSVRLGELLGRAPRRGDSAPTPDQ